MASLTDEVVEAVGNRIKSPLLGYYSLFLIVFNWKPLFYLLVWDGTATVMGRFEFVDANTSYWTLIIYPALLAISLVLAYPRIDLLITKINASPTSKKNLLQVRADHDLAKAKQELEAVMAADLGQKEKELIDRAKRDLELSKIENETVKAQLEEQFKELRAERDFIKGFESVSKQKSNQNLDSKQTAILVYLSLRNASLSGDIAAGAGIEHSKIEFWLDRLRDLGMIDMIINLNGPNKYSLTSKGREYLVNNGLV